MNIPAEMTARLESNSDLSLEVTCCGSRWYAYLWDAGDESAIPTGGAGPTLEAAIRNLKV